MSDHFEIFAGIFLGFAIIYLLTLKWAPWPGSFLVKAIPAFTSAAFFLFSSNDFPFKKFLVGAFVFCAVGDMLLSFAEKRGEKYFALGLSFFLIAHILFIIIFTQKFQFELTKVSYEFFLIAFSFLMLFLLLPKLGQLKIPVVVYITFLLAMGTTAIFHSANNWMLITGALLFAISDMIIAINKFVIKIQNGRLLYMTIYYASLALLSLAMIQVS